MLEKEEFLKTIINGIKDQIVVIDKDYRIVEVNEAFLKGRFN